MAELFTRDALAYLGHHQVGELDQVEVIVTDHRHRKRSGPRSRRTPLRDDSNDLDPLMPRRRPGTQPGRDSGEATAVDDADRLSCLEIHERRHPRLDPLPALAAGSVEDRARNGSWSVTGTNVFLAHASWAETHRGFLTTTSRSSPPVAMSLTCCDDQACNLVEIGLQSGHPRPEPSAYDHPAPAEREVDRVDN